MYANSLRPYKIGLGYADVMTTDPAFGPDFGPPTSDTASYYTNNPPLFVQPRPLVTGISTLTPVQTVMPTPNVVPNAPTIPVATATMTLRTIITGANGPINANVTVEGQRYATTPDGLIVINGLNINSIVTISCVGYVTYSAKVSEIPPRLVMTQENNVLHEVIIHPKPKPQSKNSNIGWWLLGIATVAVVINSKSKGLGYWEPKKVKAKI